MRFLGQDAAAGALRSLYAAAGAVVSGEFFGPSCKFNMNVHATRVRMLWLPKTRSRRILGR
jgi:hypothetical protein